MRQFVFKWSKHGQQHTTGVRVLWGSVQLSIHDVSRTTICRRYYQSRVQSAEQRAETRQTPFVLLSPKESFLGTDLMRLFGIPLLDWSMETKLRYRSMNSCQFPFC